MKPRGAGLLVVLTLAGCSSSGHTAQPPSFVTGWGQDAAIIAGHIAGCSGVRAEDSVALLPGTSSAASCTISGHHLVVYSWRTASDRQPVSSVGSPLHVYSQGVGWTAVTVDAAGRDAQELIARAVVASLGGEVVR